MADTTLVGSVKDLIGQAEQTNTKRTANKDLGKDAFLQLLVAQLKNQDPQKPMDDTSFIAEMAQFSSLEQMQNLNKTMEKQQAFASLTQASGMIGKYVQLQDTASNTVINGQVGEIRSIDGAVKVVIDGKEYDSANIIKVSDKAITGTTTPPKTGTA